MLKKVKLPKKVTSDLAYLCGVFAGDGSISIRLKKHDYEVKCVGNPLDEKEYYNYVIVPLLDKLFNLKVKAKYFDKNTTYGIRFWSKDTVNYLTQHIGLPIGRKYNKLKIPPIFKKKEEHVIGFIRGAADTDFGVSIKKNNYPVIVGCSATKRFMKEIGNILDKKGLHPLRYFDYRKEDSRLRKGYSIIHILEMGGPTRFKRWINVIGFNHPKHLKKIERWKKVAEPGLSETKFLLNQGP